MWCWVGGEGIEQKRKKKEKRTHEHGQQHSDCRGFGRTEVEEGMEGIKGDGKY